MKIPDCDAFIFDCDGTLTDSMPLHYLSWKKTMELHGITFEEERFYALGGMPSHKIVAMLAEENGMQLDANLVAHEKEDAFLELLHLLTPIDIVLNVAREHRGQKPQAVASGGFRRIIERQLQQLNCLEWFDTIVAAEDTQRHKPHPDCFLEAARRMGVAPERCCVFEDADLGVEAAQRAGMACIDVRNFHQPRRWTAAS